MSEHQRLLEVLGASAEARGLRQRTDISDAGWTFWELRTLNMHRVIGLAEPLGVPATVADLEGTLRDDIRHTFHRSWWRGLATGIAVSLDPGSWTPAEIAPLVDIRERGTALIQWIVVVAPDLSRAIGAHTWEQVFLSPVYRAVVRELARGGCDVSTAVKEKNGLLRLLTAVGDLEGMPFPEFHDGGDL